ncbi:uncharacterized protein N7506_000215 [Penicillium brevicompactum]|uniref:uncharacterized protein n=1 Tax=Penicillium brevicompactum TaxID=5074 RepID=UPI00253F7BCA|nr:uncharacterized protein N7506_000215 [Penicillium brevicompactum]KAJ5346962.1 hypothetical protein N7506_000215 [Penicillium brevicompactum]
MDEGMKRRMPSQKSNIDGGWNQSYIKEQWEELLTSLDAQFEKCFFQNPKDIGTGDLQRKLKNSKITWLCCDIAWILEELTLEETINFYCASFEDGVLSCGQKTNFDAIRTTLMGTTITYPSSF